MARGRAGHCTLEERRCPLSDWIVPGPSLPNVGRFLCQLLIALPPFVGSFGQKRGYYIRGGGTVLGILRSQLRCTSDLNSLD